MWESKAATAGDRKVVTKALCVCCSYPSNTEVKGLPKWASTGKHALPGCVGDQMRMKDMLKKEGVKVRFLTDHKKLSKEKDYSTKKNIVAELKKLVKWLNGAKEDGPVRQAWFVYSGHGVINPKRPYSLLPEDAPDPGGHGFVMLESIVPCDYFTTSELLSEIELEKTLQGFNENGALLAFMDCCHSGTILGLPWDLELDESGEMVGCRAPHPEAIIERYSKCGRILCISAALDAEVAYETKAGGVCTNAFLESHNKGDPPAKVLIAMNQYARDHYMKQTINMSSNVEFTDADAAVIAGGIPHWSRSLGKIMSAPAALARSLAPKPQPVETQRAVAFEKHPSAGAVSDFLYATALARHAGECGERALEIASQGASEAARLASTGKAPEEAADEANTYARGLIDDGVARRRGL